MDPESYFSASTKPRIISSSFVYKLTVFYFEVFKCRSECFEVILGFHLIFLMLPVFTYPVYIHQFVKVGG